MALQSFSTYLKHMTQNSVFDEFKCGQRNIQNLEENTDDEESGDDHIIRYITKCLQPFMSGFSDIWSEIKSILASSSPDHLLILDEWIYQRHI